MDLLERVRYDIALLFRKAMKWEIHTGPLAFSFTCSLAPLTHSLVPYCVLCSRTLLRTFVHLISTELLWLDVSIRPGFVPKCIIGCISAARKLNFSTTKFHFQSCRTLSIRLDSNWPQDQHSPHSDVRQADGHLMDPNSFSTNRLILFPFPCFIVSYSPILLFVSSRYRLKKILLTHSVVRWFLLPTPSYCLHNSAVSPNSGLSTQTEPAHPLINFSCIKIWWQFISLSRRLPMPLSTPWAS